MSVENIHPGVPFESNRNLAIGWARARLDTTTKPAVDSLSLRRRSGVRERGFQKSATIRWNEPLSPALSPLVPRRERKQETTAMVGVSRCAPHPLFLDFLFELRWRIRESGSRFFCNEFTVPRSGFIDRKGGCRR